MPSITYDDLQIELLPNESVLDALIRSGADIEFSCRKGACQVCLMRATHGDIPPEATQRLRTDVAITGHFLPCQAHPSSDLTIEPPNLAMVTFEALVTAKEELSDKVVQLHLEPEINLHWTPGQYVQLIRPDGLARHYSISSIAAEDYFLTLHIQRVPDGQFSSWAHDELQPGQLLRLQGPLGVCTYRPEFNERPLILIGTGSGIAPLHGILRDALNQGHSGPIHIYHGTRQPEDLYLDQSLHDLASRHDNVHYYPCVSQPDAPPSPDDTWLPGRATDLAFPDGFDAAHHVLYLAGNPEMVFHARYLAIAAGIRRQDILADPFETDEPYWPQDNEKLEMNFRDPELWAALDHGKKLRAILEDFYTAVYDDPRLSPFFHKSTKERAISKQYEFLASVFDGSYTYFGLKPFNAHHWMIISDELFDYREDLFEHYLRKHDLPEHLLRRWMSFQELFRREIVKSTERGMIIDGKERLKKGYSPETLAIGSLCDGCHKELPTGSKGMMHQRTGEFFCLDCFR